MTMILRLGSGDPQIDEDVIAEVTATLAEETDIRAEMLAHGAERIETALSIAGHGTFPSADGVALADPLAAGRHDMATLAPQYQPISPLGVTYTPGTLAFHMSPPFTQAIFDPGPNQVSQRMTQQSVDAATGRFLIRSAQTGLPIHTHEAQAMMGSVITVGSGVPVEAVFSLTGTLRHDWDLRMVPWKRMNMNCRLRVALFEYNGSGPPGQRAQWVAIDGLNLYQSIDVAAGDPVRGSRATSLVPAGQSTRLVSVKRAAHGGPPRTYFCALFGTAQANSGIGEVELEVQCNGWA